MKIERILLLISLAFCGFTVSAQHPSEDNNWKVVIQDDFSSFNTAIWYKGDNNSHKSKETEEPQIYKKENAYINYDGKLVLVTRAIDTSNICQYGTFCQYYNEGGHKYSSGMISSVASYKYGYFEIKAKLPTGQGYWPAFWLWNANKSSPDTDYWYNEIDIFEGIGCLSDSVTCNVHWNFVTPKPQEPDLHGNIDTIRAVNYSQQYHWYGVKWEPHEISWYVDRYWVRSIANDMEGIGIQHPMRIIINSALFPYEEKVCNTDSSNIVLPNWMLVDSVNVYQLICHEDSVVNVVYDYDTFAYGIKKSITINGITRALTSGENVFFKATDFIEIKKDFEVPLGSEMFLQIMECPD